MRNPTRMSRVRSRNRQGSAVVEFAITAPVLFIILFGMIEMGRALMIKQLLSNAARDGARSAILEGSSAEDVEQTVLSYLGGSKIGGAKVSVTPSPLTLAQGGDPVTVSISVPFNEVSWLPTPKYLSGVTLEETVIMRREVFTSSGEADEVDVEL